MKPLPSPPPTSSGTKTTSGKSLGRRGCKMGGRAPTLWKPYPVPPALESADWACLGNGAVVAGQIPHNPRCRLGSDTKAGPLRRQRVVPIGGSCRHSVSIKSRPGLPIELGAAENRRGEVEGGVFPGASFRQLGFGLHLGRQRRQDRRCPCLWFTVSRSVPAWAKRNGRQRYWQHESKRLGADETTVIFLNALAGRQRQPLAVGKAKEMWCWSRDGVRYAAETACPVGKVALLG